MAPEYLMHGQFSVKSDVFSFGVLVLEIVSGQKNSGIRHGENVEDLLSFVSLLFLIIISSLPLKAVMGPPIFLFSSYTKNLANFEFLLAIIICFDLLSVDELSK